MLVFFHGPVLSFSAGHSETLMLDKCFFSDFDLFPSFSFPPCPFPLFSPVDSFFSLPTRQSREEFPAPQNRRKSVGTRPWRREKASGLSEPHSGVHNVPGSF